MAACLSAARAATTRSAAISQAIFGPLLMITSALARGLDEGDLVDLTQCRGPGAYLGKRRLAQEAHAFFTRRAPYLRGRLLLQDHLAHAVTQVESFMDGRPS